MSILIGSNGPYYVTGNQYETNEVALNTVALPIGTTLIKKTIPKSLLEILKKKDPEVFRLMEKYPELKGLLDSSFTRGQRADIIQRFMQGNPNISQSLKNKLISLLQDISFNTIVGNPVNFTRDSTFALERISSILGQDVYDRLVQLNLVTTSPGALVNGIFTNDDVKRLKQNGITSDVISSLLAEALPAESPALIANAINQIFKDPVELPEEITTIGAPIADDKSLGQLAAEEEGPMDISLDQISIWLELVTNFLETHNKSYLEGLKNDDNYEQLTKINKQLVNINRQRELILNNFRLSDEQKLSLEKLQGQLEDLFESLNAVMQGMGKYLPLSAFGQQASDNELLFQDILNKDRDRLVSELKKEIASYQEHSALGQTPDDFILGNSAIDNPFAALPPIRRQQVAASSTSTSDSVQSAAPAGVNPLQPSSVGTPEPSSITDDGSVASNEEGRMQITSDQIPAWLHKVQNILQMYLFPAQYFKMDYVKEDYNKLISLSKRLKNITEQQEFIFYNINLTDKQVKTILDLGKHLRELTNIVSNSIIIKLQEQMQKQSKIRSSIDNEATVNPLKDLPQLPSQRVAAPPTSMSGDDKIPTPAGVSVEQLRRSTLGQTLPGPAIVNPLQPPSQSESVSSDLSSYLAEGEGLFPPDMEDSDPNKSNERNPVLMWNSYLVSAKPQEIAQAALGPFVRSLRKMVKDYGTPQSNEDKQKLMIELSNKVATIEWIFANLTLNPIQKAELNKFDQTFKDLGAKIIKSSFPENYHTELEPMLDLLVAEGEHETWDDQVKSAVGAGLKLLRKWGLKPPEKKKKPRVKKQTKKSMK